jgi:hypothetical protein
MTRLTAVFTVLCFGFVAPWASAGTEPVSFRQVQGWSVCETEYFAVWGSVGNGQTEKTAKLCETLRDGLSRIWFEASTPPRWPSKCVIVLHAEAEAFANAVAQPGTRAVGCTTLQIDRGHVTFRRIDLRCDRPNWQSSALPHELTHAVLADRLAGEPLPLWADEGLAVLSEAEVTRQSRDEALLKVVRDGRSLPVSQLLRLQSQPPAEQREAFYGQSALLVSQLIDRKSPAAFLAFLEKAHAVGEEQALRQCYGIDGVNGLAELWREYETTAAPGRLVELTQRAAVVPQITLARRSTAVAAD